MSRRPDRKPPWNGSRALVEGASHGVADVRSAFQAQLKPTTAPHLIPGCYVPTTKRTTCESLALYECCEVTDLACRIPPLMISELAAPRFGEASTVLADGRSQRPLTQCTHHVSISSLLLRLSTLAKKRPRGDQEEEQAMDPFLQAAIDEAKQGLSEGGIPIGCIHRTPVRHTKIELCN